MLEKRLGILKITTFGATGLHIILSFVAALQNRTLRELGFFFTVMGVLAFISVVGAAFIHPLLVAGVLALIMIPGMLMGFLTTIILRGFIIMIFVAPLEFLYLLYEYFITHYTIFIL